MQNNNEFVHFTNTFIERLNVLTVLIFELLLSRTCCDGVGYSPGNNAKLTQCSDKHLHGPENAITIHTKSAKAPVVMANRKIYGHYCDTFQNVIQFCSKIPCKFICTDLCFVI